MNPASGGRAGDERHDDHLGRRGNWEILVQFPHCLCDNLLHLPAGADARDGLVNALDQDAKVMQWILTYTEHLMPKLGNVCH